jgi:hypothetical protein
MTSDGTWTGPTGIIHIVENGRTTCGTPGRSKRVPLDDAPPSADGRWCLTCSQRTRERLVSDSPLGVPDTLGLLSHEEGERELIVALSGLQRRLDPTARLREEVATALARLERRVAVRFGNGDRERRTLSDETAAPRLLHALDDLAGCLEVGSDIRRDFSILRAELEHRYAVALYDAEEGGA